MVCVSEYSDIATKINLSLSELDASCSKKARLFMEPFFFLLVVVVFCSFYGTADGSNDLSLLN